MLLAQPLLQRIAELRTEQDRLRSAFINSDFDYLENFFIKLENSTAGTEGENHSDREYFFSLQILFDTYSGPRRKELQRLLQAWVDARPNSYYAYYFLGHFWETAASEIRSAKSADEVSADRWVGAALARDNAAVILLRAITLHDAPVRALFLLMQVFAYLREPDWMQALFDRKNVQGCSPDSSDIDPETWRLAQEHFNSYGGTLLPPPTSLPPILNPRNEDEAGFEYWLQQILHICPNYLVALRTAVYYLSPRWGGNHDAMEAFIQSPQCATLTEEQRGDLWWIKEDDYLDDLPDLDDDDSAQNDEVELHRAAYIQLLTRPLLPATRVYTLFAYAKFLSYLEDLKDAYACAAEACRLQAKFILPAAPSFRQFRFLARDFIVDGFPDPQGVLAQVLQLSERDEDSAWFLLLACAARHEGKWGMPCEPYSGQLDRLQLLITKDNEEHENAIEALELLWEGHHGECCWWIAHELARRGVSLAHCFLANVYRGHYVDGPKVQVDLSLAAQWQHSAIEAEIKHPRAAYLLAKRCLVPDDFIITDRQKFLHAKALLEFAIENVVDGAQFLLMQVIANSGNNEEAAWPHQHLIPQLLQSDNSKNHLTASIFLAYLYGTGIGVVCSPMLSYHWGVYAQSINDDEENEYFLTQIQKIYQGKIQKNGIRGWINKITVDDRWQEAVAVGQAYLPPTINDEEYQWSNVKAGIATKNLSIETAISNFSENPSVANRILLYKLLQEGQLFLAAESLPAAWGSGPVTLEAAASVALLTSSMHEDDDVLLVFTSPTDLHKREHNSAFFSMNSRDVMALVVQQGFSAIVLNPAGPWASISSTEIEKLIAGTW